MSDDQLREQATLAAADLDLSLSKTTVLEVATRIRKRISESLSLARTAEAS